MDKSVKKQIEYLSEFALEERLEQFKRVLLSRTRYLTVCLENIYQSQNASAVLRTCDAFGVQDVHIVESFNEFTIHKDIALGTDKWLDLNKHTELNIIENLRSNGYRIVATTPQNNSVSLLDFDLTKGKTALFFGTELTGLSDEMMDNADEFIYIPMYGFVESFNISVSVSIILQHLLTKLRSSNVNWQLTENESDDILLHWLKQSVKSSDLLLKRFFEES